MTLCQTIDTTLAQTREVAMAQHMALVGELKKALKQGGRTYADVALALGMSEPSVKRMFADGRFTLDRFDRICEFAGIEIGDLVERLESDRALVTELTEEQEAKLMADPKLFLMTYLMLNRWTTADIQRVYEFSADEIDQLLLRLDELKIVDLRLGRRVRYLLTRSFAWRRDGPIQAFIERSILPEFFRSRFDEPGAEFRFFAGSLTQESLARLREAIMDVVKEFNRLAEQDTKKPLSERPGAAAVLAIRPWHFSRFSHYKRKEFREPNGPK
jgi:DNA-binding Xre family transcriptional regulator